MVATARGGDLDAERQAAVVEAEGHLGGGQPEQVEGGLRAEDPGPADGAAVARGDASERRMQQDSVADRLGDLGLERLRGGGSATVEALRHPGRKLLGQGREHQRRGVRTDLRRAPSKIS